MSELPSGWADAPLSQIVEINPVADKKSIPLDADVNFVPMPAVEAETGAIDVSETRRFAKVKTGYTPFEANDVLFAKITPCMENGKMAVVPELPCNLGFGSTEFHVLRSPEGVLPKFVYYRVSSLGFRYDAEHNMTGAVGQKRVPEPYLSSFHFALPPTNEQRRIVDKIEQLFDLLDKGEESLRAARDKAGLYRQSLLKHAFEGHLTADWRAANPDKLEAPETLLTRIQEERDACYKQALDDWQNALANWRAGGEEGKKPTKPKRPRDFNNSLDDIEIELPVLPQGWLWQRLGYCTCGVEYGTSAKSAETGAMPVIRMGNLQAGKIDWTDLVFTSNADEIQQYSLSSGDVLFNRTNSPELVGKTSIYRGERPALFAGYLIRINQIEETVSGSYLTYFLNSITAKKHGDVVKTDGVNQSNINGNKLQEYPFPYCSLAEQSEIVSRLEAKLSTLDALEADIDAQLARSRALRQSILKRAFEGKLVPQDPTDEPASALLERIKAERAAAPKSKRKRKTPA